MVRRPKSASPSDSSGPPMTGGLKGPQRLQRILAAAGFGSRRQCEELIETGRVHVDGKLVDKLGMVVDSETAKILVDGQTLKRQKLVYFAVNKPVGVVTTNADPQGRPRVIDLVPPNERVFPVGRLDLSSEGLILLTNDGELAQRLAHPKFGIQKIYRVTVAGKVDTQALRKMREGIYISDGHVRVDGARVLKAKAKATEMEITLREGKNREIRRILARLGHKVQTLRRIAIGSLRLGDLPPGAYRPLTRDEITKLQTAAITPPKREDSSDDPRGNAHAKRPGKPTKAVTSERSEASRSTTSRPTASRSTTSRPTKSRTNQSRDSKAGSTSARPTSSRPTKASGSAPPRKTAKPRKAAPGEIVIRLDQHERVGKVIGGEPAPNRKSIKRDAAVARKAGNPKGENMVIKKRTAGTKPASKRSVKKRKS